MRFLITTACLPLVALAACAPAEESADNAPGTEQAEGGESGEADTPLPAEFVRTAWRATGENGARYTTFLDPDGRYRDLRNGDPWQEGTWEIDGEERLCFLPDDEGAALTCWSPDRMDGSDSMIASGQGGARIKLQQVEYIPPTEDDAAAE